MTSHRFRAMARTIPDEVLSFRPDFIEHQLAHAVRGPNGRTYGRTAFLPECSVMMQAWASSGQEKRLSLGFTSRASNIWGTRTSIQGSMPPIPFESPVPMVVESTNPLPCRTAL